MKACDHILGRKTQNRRLGLQKTKFGPQKVESISRALEETQAELKAPGSNHT